MRQAQEFVDDLASEGVTLISGVPCSSLGGLIAVAAAHPEICYVAAANEGDAVAIAAGAWLAGGRGAVFLQNSGLGNAVNPLTSLIAPFDIPLLIYVGWRGRPGGTDEPQHTMMGGMTEQLLHLCGFQTVLLESECPSDLHREYVRNSARIAFLIANGPLSKASGEWPAKKAMKVHPAQTDWRRFGLRPTRQEILQAVLVEAPDAAAIVATTGKCSRELFELADRPQHFYQVGSMGCASSVALGFSLSCDQKTIVLDGDGAALMRLGAIATVGAESPKNFVHILIDNEAHDSTGGQPTCSSIVDLAAVAAACGYRGIARCDDRSGFELALRWALAQEGPTFVHVKVRPGSSAALGRPAIGPRAVGRRFREYFGRAE